MNIKPEDIHYAYGTRGYIVYYKGVAIYEAGIDKHAKGLPSNIKLFKECAAREKRRILSGHVSKYELDRIKEIEEKEEASNGIRTANMF